MVPVPRRPGSSSSPTPTGSRRSTGTGRASTSSSRRRRSGRCSPPWASTPRVTTPSSAPSRTSSWRPGAPAAGDRGGARVDAVGGTRTCRRAPASGSRSSSRTAPCGRAPGRPVGAGPRGRRAVLGEATFEVPGDLPTGWHRLVAHLDAPAVDPAHHRGHPRRHPGAPRASARRGRREGRVVGLTAQLYQVRSAESWGVGDLGDLADLATLGRRRARRRLRAHQPAARRRAGAPVEPSPYLPTTRRFVNPLYLRVEDVPELARLEHAAYRRVLALGATARALNGRGPDRP